MRIPAHFSLIVLLAITACKGDPAAEVELDTATAIVAKVELTDRHSADSTVQLDTRSVVIYDSAGLSGQATPRSDIDPLVDARPPLPPKQEINKPKPPKNPKRTAANAPVMTVVDATYDFGRIAAGDVVHHEFTFINTGKRPLSIKDADVTCGCTYPSFPFLDVAPGDSATIKVQYNSVGKQGDQQATVTINSNAVDSPLLLHLVGTVVPQEGQVHISKDSIQD